MTKMGCKGKRRARSSHVGNLFVVDPDRVISGRVLGCLHAPLVFSHSSSCLPTLPTYVLCLSLTLNPISLLAGQRQNSCCPALFLPITQPLTIPPATSQLPPRQPATEATDKVAPPYLHFLLQCGRVAQDPKIREHDEADGRRTHSRARETQRDDRRQSGKALAV